MLPAQVCVEVLVEYPFFVFGQGWSSCCPDRTTQLFELSCAKLCVGDVCVSLTLRSLRNGSLADKLKAGRFSDSSHNGDPNVRNGSSPPGSGGLLLMKASSADCVDRQQVAGSGPAVRLSAELDPAPGQAEGIYRTRAAPAVQGRENVRQESIKTDLSKLQCVDSDRPSVRKRRWSAPERDQTERGKEEPPVTLPKPSFLPQEVKISIEGHSSAGSERF